MLALRVLYAILPIIFLFHGAFLQHYYRILVTFITFSSFHSEFKTYLFRKSHPPPVSP